MLAFKLALTDLKRGKSCKKQKILEINSEQVKTMVFCFNNAPAHSLIKEAIKILLLPHQQSPFKITTVSANFVYLNSVCSTAYPHLYPSRLIMSLLWHQNIA